MTVVSAEGAYIGGSILPGAGISLEALARETALLPNIEFKAPKKVIGTNTVDAMKSGIIYGSAGALDGLIDRYLEELGGSASIVITGGMGRLIAPYCTHEMTVDNRLLLRGLGIIWKKNRPAAKNN